MIAYNNNPFSYKGKLSRTAYIFTNLLINIIGFKFLYYPRIMQLLHSSSEYRELINQLAQTPDNAWLIERLKDSPKVIPFVAFIFLIPFRIIDIKRVRDVVDRELKNFEALFLVIFFSLPYVDFFSTLHLSLLKPGKNTSPSDIAKEVRVKDLKEAHKENAVELNKRLFESGKISRAEFIERRKKQESEKLN